MRARIRFADGRQPERVVDAAVLRVGRGGDIDLRGPLMPVLHSEIAFVSGAVHIRPQPGHSVHARGDSVDDAVLRPGMILFVGTSELRVLDPRPGEDLLLEVYEPAEREATGIAARALQRRFGIVRRRHLGPALLAALGAVAVLALLWLLPVLSGRRTLAERWFMVGRIAPAHAHVGDRCAACHTATFQPVADRDCKSANCHPAIASHTRPERTPLDADPCRACHREHEGPAALTDASDARCASCHAGAEARHPEWRLLNASAFAAADGHAEFRPTVVVDPRAPRADRVSLDAHPTEATTLAFSHAKHLAPGLRRRPAPRSKLAGCREPPADASVLECRTCHVPDARGDLMQPVRFAPHCQSCHDLGLDCAEPGYQVAHGDTPVREEIEGFFTVRAGIERPAPAPPGRRRPDLDLAPTVPLRAGQLASRALEDFLGPQGLCAYCHIGAKATVVDGVPIEIAVAPVRAVPTDGLPRWLPFAHFSHAPHAAENCTDCHPARTAETSAAVMLPGIARCRECHGQAKGERAAAPARCVECHRYHVDPLGLTAPAAGEPHSASAARSALWAARNATGS